MSVAFKASRAELSFQADFAEPVFHLFRDSPALHRSVFARLAKHGLRLSDMRPERGNGTLGDAHLVCSLLNSAVTLLLRPERAEIHCFDVMRLDGRNLGQVGVDFLEAIRAHAPEVPFKTYSSALALHGLLDGIRSQEFIAKFVTGAPGGLGPPLGSGAVFYYGVTADRVMSSVTVDLSAVLHDGLFLRIYAMWDGQRIAVEALPGIADEHVRDVMREFGLSFGDR